MLILKALNTFTKILPIYDKQRHCTDILYIYQIMNITIKRLFMTICQTCTCSLHRCNYIVDVSKIDICKSSGRFECATIDV